MAKGAKKAAVYDAKIGVMLRSRAILPIAIVALVVACSTYGADEPTTVLPDGGASSSGGSSSGNASSSGGSSSGSSNVDGSVVGDAADDAPTFKEACPPCSGT